MADNQVKVVITGQNDAGATFTQVGEQLAALNEKVLRFGETLEQLAIAELGAKLVEFGKSALEAEANIAKMAERTGIGVEQLSQLDFAARVTGVSTDTLEKGIKKLQVALEAAANGGEKQTAAFTSLGISAKDATGKVLEAGPALELIGAKFATMKDGTEKAALAVQLFGRSGTELIPFLNDMKGLTDEAEKLGLTLNDKDVAAAHAFEQSMFRVRAEGEALTRHFLTGLLPALDRIVKAFSGDTKDSFSVATKAGEVLGDALKYVMLGFYGVATSVNLAIENLPRLALVMSELALDQPLEAIKGIKELFKEIHTGASDQLIHQFEDFKAKLFAPLDPAKGDDKPKPTGGLNKVTKVDTGIDAVIRARLKAETDAAQLSADFTKSMNALELKNLDDLYKHELIAVNDYFDRKKQLQLDSLAAEADALNKELNLQADGIAALQKKIALQKDDTKGKQEANKLRVEEITLQAQFDKNVEKLRVNQHTAAELQHKDAEGNIDQLAAQAEQMERTGAEAERLGQRINDIYAVLQEQITRVTVAEKNHELTTTEAQTKINSLNAQGVQELAGMVQRYKDLAAASGDPKLIVNAEKLTTKLDELGKKADWVGDQVINAGQTSFENLFAGIMDGSKTAAQSFADFGKSILQSIDQIIAKMSAMWIMEQLIGFIGKLGGAASAAGGGGDSFGSDFAPGFDDSFSVPFHAQGGTMGAGEMGIVGDAGPELWIPDTAGTVVPMSKAAGFGGDTHNHYYDFRGADPGSEQRIMSAIRNMGLWAKNAAQVEMKERQARSI